MSKPKNQIKPGVGEGHPDDRACPNFDAVCTDLLECIKSAESAGLHLIVSLYESASSNPLVGLRDARWMRRAIGDPMVLIGMAHDAETMLKDSWGYPLDSDDPGDEDEHGEEESAR